MAQRDATQRSTTSLSSRRNELQRGSFPYLQTYTQAKRAQQCAHILTFSEWRVGVSERFACMHFAAAPEKAARAHTHLGF